MWRKNLTLLLMIVGLSIVSVNLRYQLRTMVVHLERARADEQALIVEQSARQVQQVAAQKSDRIVGQVRAQDMHSVDPTVTYYITPALAQTTTLPVAGGAR